MAISLETVDLCHWTSLASEFDAATDISCHQFSPVLDDHMLNMHWDPESEFNSFMEEQCIVGDMQYQIQTPGFQMSSAMDYGSILYSCQTHFPQSQHTVASLDLSTGTWQQLPQACLPATSPLPSGPLQLEVPQTKTAPVAVHAEVPAFLPHAAHWPQQVQQVLPAPAHSRLVKSRGQPIARDRASAERSARSGSRGRSRSRSPIRDAVGATFEASADEGGPGEVSPRASKNEEQVAKKPAKKKGSGKKKGTGAKKKGTGGKKGGRKKEKTSRYLGVSFHTGNRKWRTTVYYEDVARHMGYHDVELEAAKQYDEVAVVVWGEDADINFSVKDYPDQQTLEARWLHVLEEKVEAQKKRAEEAEKKKAEEAARREHEETEAGLEAVGGNSKRSPTIKPQHKRNKRASSSSDSDVTISDASLENLLDNDDEGEICSSRSRRSPASVATRAPRPRREAAQKAQENWKALMEDLADCEKESDEVPTVQAAACRHARATAAAEQRLRASQARYLA
ncbi:g7853 [Coccomyxa elongata]